MTKMSTEEAQAGLLAALMALVEQERASVASLPLVANENRASDLALWLQSSPLSQRYLLGTAEERRGGEASQTKGGLMLNGLPAVTAVELEAASAAKAMFSAATVDFRPLSGVHTTMCTMLGLTRPGAAVLSIDPAHGGHFATRPLAESTGRRSLYLPWDVAAWSLDVPAAARQVADLEGEVVLLLDHGTPLFPLPVAELRAALGRRASIFYDASHTLGLIAGGQFQDPLGEGADLLQGNTHKTLPGPQKGIVMAREAETGERLARAMCAGLVSSQHTHHALALHMTLLEMRHFGRPYARQVVENARTLARWLRHWGLAPVERNGEATQSHLVLLAGFAEGAAYRACERMRACGIEVNARVGAHGEFLRIGVQEMTRRGAVAADMRFVADFLVRACCGDEDTARLRDEVVEFMGQFQAARYSFDQSPEISALLRRSALAAADLSTPC
jgi:glycine/serine hydroxymethyltransferase